MKKNYPPYLQTTSSRNPGFHAKKTSAYFLFTTALLFSPSYELANKLRTGRLTRQQKNQLPEDFDQVLNTYDLVGDVNNLVFSYWWLERGMKILGSPYQASDVEIIEHIDFGARVDIESINQKVKNNLLEERKKEGLPATLLVSIPLNLSQTDIVKSIKRILNKFDIQSPVLPKKPLIQIIGNRIHSEKILLGFRLLYLQAMKPKQELWRLGAEAAISTTYSPVLDPKGPRKPKDAIEMDDRAILTKITNRTKTRFERIAENAARGQFICDKKINYVPFNYAELGERLLQNQKTRKSAKQLFSERNRLQDN